MLPSKGLEGYVTKDEFLVFPAFLVLPLPCPYLPLDPATNGWLPALSSSFAGHILASWLSRYLLFSGSSIIASLQIDDEPSFPEQLDPRIIDVPDTRPLRESLVDPPRRPLGAINAISSMIPLAFRFSRPRL